MVLDFDILKYTYTKKIHMYIKKSSKLKNVLFLHACMHILLFVFIFHTLTEQFTVNIEYFPDDPKLIKPQDVDLKNNLQFKNTLQYNKQIFAFFKWLCGNKGLKLTKMLWYFKEMFPRN